MKLQQQELIALDNSLKLKFKNFYSGESNGMFHTKYPHARLLFCIDCNEGSFLEDGGGRIFLQRGMWLLVPPFAEIRHCHLKHQRLSIHFNFSMLHGMEILSCFAFTQHGIAPELLPLAESMNTGAIEPMQFLNGAHLLVRTILHRLVQMPEFELCRRRSSHLPAYNGLTQWLQQQMNPHVKVAEMARFMNSGEQTFARKFVAETGITPRKFNENIIINRAVELLEEGRLSIKEIAGELHFSNEYYFSRFFKRTMKYPPATFRKEMYMQ